MSLYLSSVCIILQKIRLHKMVFYFRFTQNQTGFQQFDNNMALTTYVTLVCRLKVDSVVLFWPFYYR